jgi:membrane protease YdiL (CAAX protease family)
VALIVTVALTGLAVRVAAGPSPGVAPGSRVGLVYLPTLVVQWALVFYVCRVGRPQSVLKQLLGHPWNTSRRACVDGAIAISTFVFIHAVESFWPHSFATRQSASLLVALPQTATEQLVWIAVAVSVGFAEEVVYRGYLLAQLSAFTGSTAAGVVLQATLFGLAHSDQGVSAAIRIAIYGIGFAVVALARRSLLPGIVSHAAIDIVSGVVAMFRGGG